MGGAHERNRIPKPNDAGDGAAELVVIVNEGGRSEASGVEAGIGVEGRTSPGVRATNDHGEGIGNPWPLIAAGLQSL